MQRLVLPLLGIALLGTACGGGAGTTVEDTWDAYLAATRAEDYGAIYDIVAPTDTAEVIGMKMRPEMAEFLGIEKDALEEMTPRDFFIAFMTRTVKEMPEHIEKMKKAEFKESKIEGSRATVTYVVDGEESTESFLLVDGKWYLHLQ